jgi:hypothetical protein
LRELKMALKAQQILAGVGVQRLCRVGSDNKFSSVREGEKIGNPRFDRHCVR